MKNTHTVKSLLVASLLTASASAFAGTVTVAQFSTPDENQPNCADTPAEMASMPDIMEIVNQFGGLDAIVGTWKLGGLAGSFSNQQVSFKYDTTKFMVQTNMEPSEQVSVCSAVNQAGEKLLRVAVHSPGCPENKNIYIKATKEPGKMQLTAYDAVKKLGGPATFNKKSDTPLPEGQPVPPVACAKE